MISRQQSTGRKKLPRNEPGQDNTLLARKAKGTNWFVGNVMVKRHVRQTLNLTSGGKEISLLSFDAKSAHYKTNPQAYIYS
jgi:hypothetical protein